MHAYMPHRQSVADCYRIEFEWNPAGRADTRLNILYKPVQMHMSWNSLGEAISHGDERLIKILISDPQAFPYPPMGGSFNSTFNSVTSQLKAPQLLSL